MNKPFFSRFLWLAFGRYDAIRDLTDAGSEAAVVDQV
jgi:hypothetical protein